MRSALIILFTLSACFGAAKIDSIQFKKILADSTFITAGKFTRLYAKSDSSYLADSSKKSNYTDTCRASKISDSTKKNPDSISVNKLRVGLTTGSIIDTIKIVDDVTDMLEITIGAKTWQFLPVGNK